MIGLEAFVPEPSRGSGRPPEDRRALARAFVAKAMLGVPTTKAPIERLDVDKSLRRILGWERRSQVPSEATFSRAFAEFAECDLPARMHAALIERSLGGRSMGYGRHLRQQGGAEHFRRVVPKDLVERIDQFATGLDRRDVAVQAIGQRAERCLV